MHYASMEAQVEFRSIGLRMAAAQIYGAPSTIFPRL